MARSVLIGPPSAKTPVPAKAELTTSDCAIPDSIWPEATMRRLSTEPCVASATATSPGTPQLPPSSQGSESAGLEIAPASTPPISKKLPAVAAAPMRKKRGSCAPAGVVRHNRRTMTTAPSGLRQRTPNIESIVSPGETAVLEDNTDHHGLQHHAARSGASDKDRAGWVRSKVPRVRNPEPSRCRAFPDLATFTLRARYSGRSSTCVAPTNLRHAPSKTLFLPKHSAHKRPRRTRCLSSFRSR